MRNDELLEKIREMMPPVFPATQLDKLSGGIYCWATIQNQRSRDKKDGVQRFPDGTFTAITKRKVLIDRDKFLSGVNE